MPSSQKRPDKYKSFEQMRLEEKEGIDYTIETSDRHTSVAIFAPHAGHIEPGTSEISKAIAREEFSIYCFEGLKPGRLHSDLHITSTNFDEPRALTLARKAEIVVTIHGRRDDGDSATIWLGGLENKLKEEVAAKLTATGFKAIASGHRLEGREPNNICNQGTRGAGVQFELPRTLRNRLVEDSKLLDDFAQAVRGVLQEIK